MGLEEQVESLKWIGQDAQERGAQAILHAGDVFDRLSTPTERNAAIEVFQDWANRMPVVVVYGNHDRPGDLDFLAEIRAKNTIEVHSRPGLSLVGKSVVACLPWPRKAHVVAALGSTSAMDVSQAVIEGLQSILSGFRFEFEGQVGYRLLLAHAELGAASLDNGQPVMGRCDIPLSEADLLDTRADAVLLGHIHKGQTLSDRIHYPGSPRPTAFGQHGPHGYTMVSLGENLPQFERITAPHRAMVTIEAEWGKGDVALRTEDGNLLENHYLVKSPGNDQSFRLSYTVDESNRSAAHAQVEVARDRLLAGGAHFVKIDARVTTIHRVRSEAIRDARTTHDRVEAWWASREERPGSADSVLTKLSELEEAVAA
jgi:exonuclease SbcD